jgi:SRSO17 transposase
VSHRGHAFIDRELYLPKSWTGDKERMTKAHVPQELIDSANGGFATKPALALAMIERAIAANVPFSFVAADTVYGVGDIETALRRAAKGYVLGVKSNDTFYSWGKPSAVAGTAKEIADRLPLSAWKRLSAGAGTKGERLHDWAYLELADLAGGDDNEAQGGQVWTRGLLIRRKIADGDLAFFTTWAPSGTTIEALAKIEGHRWAIEDSFEAAKNELGLDHNETRSWHGWRRHVSLVMLAFAMMATIRVHANGPTTPSPKKIRRAMTTKTVRLSSTAN